MPSVGKGAGLAPFRDEPIDPARMIADKVQHGLLDLGGIRPALAWTHRYPIVADETPSIVTIEAAAILAASLNTRIGAVPA